MGSSPQNQLNCDLVCFGSIYSDTQRRGSKSQMCLHKILHIITTVPPLTTADSSPFSGSEIKESSAENDVSDENKGSGFDLNVVSPEMEESLSGFSSSSTTVKTGGGPPVIDDRAFIVNPENGCDRVEKEKADENRVEKTERSLSLLIEAARLIFGEFEDDNKSESKVKKDEMAADEANEKRLKRRSSSSSSLAAEEMGEVFKAPEPSSPVVRSKRRRTPVLPNRYKDSVLEPLTRLSRTRSSIMPTKRRQR